MKKKVDKSLVTVYYRIVKTSPVMASVIVTPTLKDPSQTLAAAEEELWKKDRAAIKIIASDFHVPKEPEAKESKKVPAPSGILSPPKETVGKEESP